MPREIAVYVDHHGETSTPLYEDGKIMVYARTDGNWQMVREKNFMMEKHLGIKGLRHKMAEMVNFLQDCRIFIGLSVVGIPYFELEKVQCSIWEFQGKPEEFLDYVLEQEETAQKPKAKSMLPVPMETADGQFTISIKEIQENNTGFTTKQVLLPLIRQGKFYSLDVVCNHVPPWLEAELMAGNFRHRVIEIGKREKKIVITKKCWGEC